MRDQIADMSNTDRETVLQAKLAEVCEQPSRNPVHEAEKATKRREWRVVHGELA